MTTGIDPDVAPSGPGCVECEAAGGWWVHLRRCAQCGHVGCCDSSPSQHATGHFKETAHPVVQSYEPGEDWFWDYSSESVIEGPRLAVEAFRAGRLEFRRIVPTIADVLARHDVPSGEQLTVDDVLAADVWARNEATRLVGS